MSPQSLEFLKIGAAAADLARMARRSGDERVLAMLDTQTLRTLLTNSKRAPLGILLLAALLWNQSGRHRILVVVGLILATLFVNAAIARRLLRRPGPVSRRGRWFFLVNVAVSGSAWGLVGLLDRGADHWAHVVVAVYASALVASAVISHATSTLIFRTFVLPFAATMTATLLPGAGDEGRVLALTLLLWLAFAVPMHHDLHALHRSATEREFHNADLVATMQGQQREMEIMHERLVHDATHDALTGLANRVVFHEHLQRALAGSRRYGGMVAVLYLDLDRFKVINDSLGHSAGDDLLRLFAARVRPLLRESDVLARLGGDEFSILLSDLNDPAETTLVAQRILGACQPPFRLGGREVVTTVSIGVAQNWDLVDQADDLLRRADVALYRAKELGRNRVEMFDDSLRTALDHRLDDELEVRRALDEGQIVAWLQPEVELATGRIVGAEALARWEHPTEGVLLPGRFLPIIEECGLSLPLLRAIVRDAGRALAEWEQAGLLDDEFRIWANVYPEDLQSDRSLEKFEAFAAATGVSTGRLGVEVTEHAMLRDHSLARDRLQDFKALGLAVAVDDFGTGHSSLALLQSLPIDVVKVDRSFVRDMVDDQRDRALVRAIVRLARDLGLEPLAEGVENDAQRELLVAMGCTYGQGFHYSPAVPVATFATWLEHGAPWLASRCVGSGVAAVEEPGAEGAQGDGPQPAVAVAGPR